MHENEPYTRVEAKPKVEIIVSAWRNQNPVLPHTGASRQQSLARDVPVPFAYPAQDASTAATSSILRTLAQVCSKALRVAYLCHLLTRHKMPTHYPLPQSCASGGKKLLVDAALPLEAPRLPFSLVKKLLADDHLLLDDAALPLELHRLFFSAVKNLLEDDHLLLEVHRLLFSTMKKLLEVDLPLSGILPQQFVGPTIFLLIRSTAIKMLAQKTEPRTPNNSK